MVESAKNITIYVGPDFNIKSVFEDPISSQIYEKEIFSTLKMLIDTGGISSKDKCLIRVSNDEVELPFGIRYPFIEFGEEVIILERHNWN